MMLQSLRLAFISSVFTLGSLMLMFALLWATPSRSAVAAPTAVFNVNSTSDAIDANPGNGVCQTSTVGQCTLRAAIMEANALPGADTIVVPAGTYNLIRPGNDDTAVNGDLDITSTLTISGAGYANTLIDGASFPLIEPSDLPEILGALPPTSVRAVWGTDTPYGAAAVAELTAKRVAFTPLDRREGVTPVVDLVRARRVR